MGVRHVVDRHYPYPDRYFERNLFRALETRGYDYRRFNAPGACTLSYDTVDIAQNSGMADWIPEWCFWWIEWALKSHDGRCEFKLDWFAGRGLDPDPRACRVLHPESAGGVRLSDHEPIACAFRLPPSP